MKKKLILMLITTLLLSAIVAVPVSAASARATYYRGSFMMWTRDNVDFVYKNGKVTSSSGYQQAGWIFPNISRNNGISKYSSTSSCQKWRAKNTIGVGVPTPWGDVTIYNYDFIHRLVINGNGSWSAWSD